LVPNKLIGAKKINRTVVCSKTDADRHKPCCNEMDVLQSCIEVVEWVKLLNGSRYSELFLGLISVQEVKNVLPPKHAKKTAEKDEAQK
jgi:hypothetical protein